MKYPVLHSLQIIIQNWFQELENIRLIDYLAAHCTIHTHLEKWEVLELGQYLLAQSTNTFHFCPTVYCYYSVMQDRVNQFNDVASNVVYYHRRERNFALMNDYPIIKIVYNKFFCLNNKSINCFNPNIHDTGLSKGPVSLLCRELHNVCIGSYSKCWTGKEILYQHRHKAVSISKWVCKLSQNVQYHIYTEY